MSDTMAPGTAALARAKPIMAALAVVGVGPDDASSWGAILSPRLATHKIVSSRQVAAFLANASHETGGFTAFEENLNYSVKGLREGFGRHRIDEDTLRKVGRVDGTHKRPADKAGIANAIYGGEWGRTNLGNAEPGDGWTFRGRGIFQLTGRANYARYGRTIGLNAEQVVELLDDPLTARGAGADAACWFFIARKVGAAADRDDIREVRRLINGGDKGLGEVTELYAKAKAFLGAA